MSSTRASMPQKKSFWADDGKVINDPIHGPMYFSELLIAFIDTEHFQRLRDIKQLGATSFIYPGGVHTRFAHSLGVCHLTGVSVKFMRERNPEFVEILTKKKLECLEIAALCHDLGHGPFSRVYQDQFLKRLRGTDWKHSDMSVLVFESIIKEERVKNALAKHDINDRDIVFIKHALTGQVPTDDMANRFLYEIVRNRRNGIDCNAFDSILRDTFYVGVKSAFNYKRIMENSKICKVKGEYRLCLRYKERLEVSSLFVSLWELSSKVYTHKTTRAIEMMLAEAMNSADHYFKISEARDDLTKLASLSDNIVDRIYFAEDNDDEGLKNAKEMLKRIKERKLYQFCGQISLEPSLWRSCSFDASPEDADDSGHEITPTYPQNRGTSNPPTSCQVDERKVCKEVARQITGWKKLKVDISKEDIFVEVISISYGNGRDDPLQNIDFINKEGTLVEGPPTVIKHGIVSMKEQYIRVYCRDTGDEKKREIQQRFYGWRCQEGKDVPKDMEKVPIEHDDESIVGNSAPASCRRRLNFDASPNDIS